MADKPLAGIKILDLTRLLPGPFCTLYLADLGADVVKVEDTKAGDYCRDLSPDMFQVVNRNKRGLRLDYRSEAGREVFKRLVENADVLVESFRPGVMESFGLGYETLKAINPKLVYCAITGYGKTGPYRDKAGHDMNYCAYAGVLDQIGKRGESPVSGNIQIADLAGGGLTAAVGILASIIRAQRTGKGDYVDVAMMDGTMALAVVALSTWRAIGTPPARGTDMLSGGLANYQVYECKDGGHIALGALEPKFWLAFCQAVERPDLAQRPIAAGQAGDETRAMVAELFLTKTRDEWAEFLADHDCCAAPVLNLAEAENNPQVQARGMILQDPHGKQFACPIKLDSVDLSLENPAPKRGEHSNAILSEAGLSDKEIAELRADKLI